MTTMLNELFIALRFQEATYARELLQAQIRRDAREVLQRTREGDADAPIR